MPVSQKARVRNRNAGLASVSKVEDSSPGIPADLHTTIFEPFARGPPQTNEDVGLGLATVKRLTEAHAGTVGLQSSVGVGTIFCIELPLAKASEQIASSAQRNYGS
jgi:signal transduction histidine kinase